MPPIPGSARRIHKQMKKLTLIRERKRLLKNSGEDSIEKSSYLSGANGILTNPVRVSPKASVSLLEEETLIATSQDIDNSSNSITPSLQGRRIVEIAHFFKRIQEMNDHGALFNCSFSNMICVSEIRKGLSCTFKFKCNMCNKEETIATEEISQKEDRMNINTAAVSGAVAIGIGCSQLEELTCAMNMPCMSSGTYSKYHDRITQAWTETALEEMKKGAEEEKQIAIQLNEIDSDGIPILTVVGDGAWAKRSYRNNYNSLAGVAAIVGYRTRKILFIGVRSVYCTICSRAKSRGQKPKIHACSKNWNSSSTSMEQDIILEGFAKSMELYGVKYARYIGDGDSSVYTKICQAMPYYPTKVTKIECRNHVLRRFCNNIKENVCSSKEPGTKLMRPLIKSQMVRLRNAIVGAITYRKGQSEFSLAERANLLKVDILNGPRHVFGDHSSCDKYFCGGPKEGESNYIIEMQECGLYACLMKYVNLVAEVSNSLIHDVDSNIAEHYNSIVAKFTGGKRVNYSLKNGYFTRCTGAVISNNTRQIHTAVHKKMFNTSPGIFTKKVEEKRVLQNSNVKRRLSLGMKRKRPRHQAADSNYGPNACVEVTQDMRKQFLEGLTLTAEQRHNLERDTIGQAQSTKWHEERSKRLTASHFGDVCVMRAATDKHKRANEISTPLNPNIQALQWGKINEKRAIEQFEQERGVKVQASGLFVDEQFPFLAATPDGLIENDTIIEVKCPLSTHDLTIDEAVPSNGQKRSSSTVNKTKKIISCLERATDGSIKLKPRHKYMFQIQGQLHITKRQKCLFVVWTTKGMFIQEIFRDDNFWKKNMENQLQKFVKEAYLECIIRRNYT